MGRNVLRAKRPEGETSKVRNVQGANRPGGELTKGRNVQLPDIYMDALKFSGLPDYAHRYYSQHFSWAFVRIEAMNVPTKFEVRSFTRS